MENIAIRAVEAYEKEARFRRMAQACVAFAMNERGPVDPDHADADAHDIALLATATLLQRIYDEDAELGQLRQINAHLEKMAKEFIVTAPPRPLVAAEFSEQP